MGMIQKLFEITNFIDTARWQGNESNYSLINYFEDGISDDEKILTHWLSYITDRQTSWERIWDVGGFIFSQLASEIKKKQDLNILNPEKKSSFFISVKDYNKINPYEIKKKKGYLFVSRVKTGKNDGLIDYGFEPDEFPYFISRYYPADYKAILNTLFILKDHNYNIIRYIKTVLENNVGNLKDSDSIPKLLFSLYLLSYHGIGQPKADDINFQQFMKEAKTRAKEVNSILSDQEKFLQAFEKFKVSRIYDQKRAWCSLRDYLKSQEFRRLFFRALKQEGYKGKGLRSKKLLTKLELPGDVWNNRPKFRNCILKSTEYEKNDSKLAELLRKIYEKKKPAVGYPEQFDITFDLVEKLCEQDRCEMCPYGLLNGKAKEFDKLCVYDEKYFCPVLLVSCGYKIQCVGAKCILQKMKRHLKMDPILKEIEKIESEKINYQELSDDYFEIIQGKIPILLSAPHGARPYRNGKPRNVGEDEYTASIAIMLGNPRALSFIKNGNASGVMLPSVM